MGWDYTTYQTQPSFFIHEIITFMNAEAQKQELDIKESELKQNLRSKVQGHG